MDGGWYPSVVLRFVQHHAENPHGCGFSAAQAIVAEILFAERKKIGADSAVPTAQQWACAQMFLISNGCLLWPHL
jgi:hypothetical protein